MDSLKQYAAPWGYQLLERWSPRGRGYSLQARGGQGQRRGRVLIVS